VSSVRTNTGLERVCCLGLLTAYLASEVATDDRDDQLVAVRADAIVDWVGDVHKGSVEVGETGSWGDSRRGRGGRAGLRDGPRSSYKERG
jgi:hypothetical protein